MKNEEGEVGTAEWNGSMVIKSYAVGATQMLPDIIS